MSELIDRQALLDECMNHYEVGNIEQNCTMDWICKAVRNFPAASPWHSVEEEPPDGNEDAVIYYEWTGISGRVYRETSIISLNELIVLGRRPIAWMEKPDPQKEENEEGFVALAIKETERSEE